eukprot:365118-Chlamydomonas_euryale.AAC.3
MEGAIGEAVRLCMRAAGICVREERGWGLEWHNRQRGGPARLMWKGTEAGWWRWQVRRGERVTHDGWWWWQVRRGERVTHDSWWWWQVRRGERVTHDGWWWWQVRRGERVTHDGWWWWQVRQERKSDTRQCKV